MRNYKYQLKVRKQKHMQKLSLYKTGIAQFKSQDAAIKAGLGRAWSKAQTKISRVADKAQQVNQKKLLEVIANSKYAKLQAAGRTGRSIQRQKTAEAADLGRFYAKTANALTDANEDFMFGVKAARRKARAASMQQYAKIAFEPTTDVAPPRPVMQNVGLAAFNDLLSIAGAGMSIYSGFKGG